MTLPPSLAATITAAALAGVAVATAPLAAVAHSAAAATGFWSSGKAILATLLLAGTAVLVVQQRQLAALRAENQALVAQQQQAAANFENASQQARDRNDELQRLQRDHAELLRLRNEVSLLRRQPAATVQPPALCPPPVSTPARDHS